MSGYSILQVWPHIDLHLLWPTRSHKNNYIVFWMPYWCIHLPQMFPIQLPPYVACGDPMDTCLNLTATYLLQCRQNLSRLDGCNYLRLLCCALWGLLVRLFPRNCQIELQLCFGLQAVSIHLLHQFSMDSTYGYWPPNWRWQPRVLNKKTKRFTKGMVLKYYQEILYPILNGPIGKRLKAAPLQGC